MQSAITWRSKSTQILCRNDMQLFKVVWLRVASSLMSQENVEILKIHSSGPLGIYATRQQQVFTISFPPWCCALQLSFMFVLNAKFWRAFSWPLNLKRKDGWFSSWGDSRIRSPESVTKWQLMHYVTVIPLGALDDMAFVTHFARHIAFTVHLSYIWILQSSWPTVSL